MEYNWGFFCYIRVPVLAFALQETPAGSEHRRERRHSSPQPGDGVTRGRGGCGDAEGLHELPARWRRGIFPSLIHLMIHIEVPAFPQSGGKREAAGRGTGQRGGGGASVEGTGAGGWGGSSRAARRPPGPPCAVQHVGFWGFFLGEKNPWVWKPLGFCCSARPGAPGVARGVTGGRGGVCGRAPRPGSPRDSAAARTLPSPGAGTVPRTAPRRHRTAFSRPGCGSPLPAALRLLAAVRRRRISPLLTAGVAPGPLRCPGRGSLPRRSAAPAHG